MGFPRLALNLVVVLLSLAAGASAYAQSLITNGSFETGPAIPGGSSFATLSNGSTAITGWTVTGSEIDYIGPDWDVRDGSYAVDLDGASAIGGIQQTFTTIPGDTYLVAFALSGNPEGTPQIKQVRVSVDSFTQTYSFMAEEAAISRLYGGIHFSSDNNNGLEVGREFGRRVVEYARPDGSGH